MSASYVFLAEGFEETEALATLDVLRRGRMEVYTVAIDNNPYVTGSHGITVHADKKLSEIPSGEIAEGEGVMVFPGGMPGTKNLAADKPLMDLMKRHFANHGIVAAICAAPGLVASQLDGLSGRKFTCFDGFETYMQDKGAVYVKAPAVVDGNLVTGRGAGCAVDFGLAILSVVKGAETVAQVRHGMMLD